MTVFLVMLGWVFFRAESISQGFGYIVSLFDFGNYYTHVAPSSILTIDPRSWFIFFLAAFICFFPAFPKGYGWLQKKADAHQEILYWGILALSIVSTMKVITGSNSPFIYFNF